MSKIIGRSSKVGPRNISPVKPACSRPKAKQDYLKDGSVLPSIRGAIGIPRHSISTVSQANVCPLFTENMEQAVFNINGINLLNKKALTDKEAQFNLGNMYYQGQDVVKDVEKAAELYLLAANQGHVEARFNLGVLYAKKEWKAYDPCKAFSYFKQAAGSGHEHAKFLIAKKCLIEKGAKESKVAAWNEIENLTSSNYEAFKYFYFQMGILNRAIKCLGEKCEKKEKKEAWKEIKRLSKMHLPKAAEYLKENKTFFCRG
ncbi:hypothetical protein DID78_04420 [Candidatus Marinamargulisbacteria bacterium SCGC AG-343-D04]|nr:hypothetical protein DID78_04420 [Candidatus Marinamargulisbacteria bacterium SCGC AG-343-D04]